MVLDTSIMDDSYRTNALHSQQFHGGHGSSHTLPPLNQQQASSYPPIYGQPPNSTQQAPLSQYHPATSAPGGNVPPLRPLQPSYGLSSAAFSSAQANMNMYTTTASHGGPAPIAPAPLPGTLHELRPMPPGGLGLGHPYATQLLSHPHQMANQEPEPIHVVGQQGRRGVLPTTPGRMAPTSAKQPINPTKNEENKFECPSCNKTYLHLKHLKRHLLRHTGERPYQCHLCKDTFSRSDILKRHFQKCSIRRGNPTGASHLAHSQAHLRKNRLSAGGTADQTFIPPMATTMAYSGTFVPSVSAVTGMPMTPEHSQYANGGSVQSLSARTSRSNSLIRPPMHENRRSMSSLDLANANRANFDAGGDFRVPASMAGTVNHGAAFASPQHQTSQVQNSFGYNPSATQSELNGDFAVKSESVNVTNFARGGGGNLQGLSHGQDDALAWPTSYNAPGQEAYLATNPSSAPPAMKTDANHFDSEYHGQNDSPDAIFGHLYTGVATFGEPNADFESWLAQNSSLSPLQLKVDSLVSFCFPDGQPADPKNISILKSILTVENVQHFVKLYGNFHSHWPLIHFPSFNIDSTSSGLLMTMICVGAVYSDRIDQDTVRWLMSVVNAAVHNTSRIFTYSPTDSIPPENMRSDIEDVQTLILLQAILVWHGTPETRADASAQYQPKIVNAAKTLGLLQTFGYDHPKCSILHEPGPIPDPQTLKNSWSWAEWVEQEKCIRTLYLLLLVDAAFVIFFNAPPNFNIRDIRLPLPADDAAWEARTAEECANALGLYGPKKQAKNITGSRQLKQMQIGEAFKIMQSSHDFQRCSTNVYSKFILIHALHIQIWYIHRLLVYPAQSPVTPTQSIMAFSSNSSGTSSPLAHNEWVGPDGSTGPLGAGHSGRTTPTEGMMSSSTYTPQLQHDLKALKTSMDRWKRSWDFDLALQYPPPTPRTGFCRDGIHYYHLANYLLRAKPMEWQLPSEARMQRTFHLLNQIKSRVANEQEFKGLDKGSLTHMDDGYALTTTIDHGVEKLTLDMKRLFTPVEGSGSQDEATP